MAILRRAAVLFKDSLGRGIFTTERGVTNVPGGKMEGSEVMDKTAMREVREELGCWPEIVPRLSDSSMFVDCGCTRYFVVQLSASDLNATFDILTHAFSCRSSVEKRKNTDVQIETFHSVRTRKAEHVRSEVDALLTILNDDVHPPVEAGIVLAVRSVGASDSSATEAVAPPASQSVEHRQDDSRSGLAHAPVGVSPPDP
jgi:hypothetical protein